MLEAKKSVWFEKIFAVYNRNLFRRRFASLRADGLENLAKKRAEIPLIVYANHSSWWDGLVAFEISRRARLDSYIMMEERQLERLFLFRRLGAFSVVRENPRRAARSIVYAANLLKANRQRTLWIFPQGEIAPNDRRPLKFYSGLARTIEKIGVCQIVSLAMRYEFLGEFKPHVFVRVGEMNTISNDSRDFDSKTLTKIYEADLTENLETLRRAVTDENTSEFSHLI